LDRSLKTRAVAVHILWEHCTYLYYAYKYTSDKKFHQEFRHIPDVPFAYMITIYSYVKMLEAKRSSSDSNRMCRRNVLKKNWTKMVLDK